MLPLYVSVVIVGRHLAALAHICASTDFFTANQLEAEDDVIPRHGSKRKTQQHQVVTTRGQLGALSRQGTIRPFSADADGLLQLRGGIRL